MDNMISVKGKAIYTIIYRSNVIKAGEEFCAEFTKAEYDAFKTANCFEEYIEKKPKTGITSVKTKNQ